MAACTRRLEPSRRSCLNSHLQHRLAALKLTPKGIRDIPNQQRIGAADPPFPVSIFKR